MGTIHWPLSGGRHSKRERKFTLHEVPIALAEARWKCETCPGVIASDADRYCLHCKTYWQDVHNGLFDFDYQPLEGID